MTQIRWSLFVGLVLSTACTMYTPGPRHTTATTYPPAPAGYSAAPPPSGVIEAGCTFSGSQLRGDIGSVFQVACPAGCEGSGGLWGSDVYTLDSRICKAGIHAGAIPYTGGVMTVRIEPGRPAYRGSDRNGIRSHDYGGFRKSYAVFTAGGQPPAPPPTAAYSPPAPPAGPPPGPPPAPAASAPPTGGQVIEAGCSFNANQIRAEVGSAHVVHCLPGCASDGGALWGTDAYTGDSRICKAAVHAGLINDAAGGTVRVVLEPGRPAYRGMTRNGVRSRDYGSYPRSYHLEPAQ